MRILYIYSYKYIFKFYTNIRSVYKEQILEMSVSQFIWSFGHRPSVVDWGVVCLLAASAGPESVTRTMGAA